MATRPTQAITTIPLYNLDPYDEATNPYGFDAGGHIYNHLQSFRYVVDIEQYLTALASEVEDERVLAQAAREDAQQAASTTASTLTATFNGQVTAAQTAREGAETAQGAAEDAAGAAADSAAAAATFDPSYYYDKAASDARYAAAVALAEKADTDLSNVSQADARTKVGSGTMAYRNVTISPAAPSGGVDGDVWFKV